MDTAKIVGFVHVDPDYEVEMPTCWKVAYKTAELARVVLKDRQGRNRKESRVYKCEVCGEFHITSRKKEARKW